MNAKQPIRTAAIAIALFAVAAVGYYLKFQPLWRDADWRWIVLIPIGMVVASFCYGYLGARIGANRSRQIICAVLATALVAGIWVLTRYLDHRH